MTYDLLPGLAVFAFVTSITPGPNNLMLMASGANFGFRRTIPHMLGIFLGFTAMVVLVGVGVLQVLDRYPLADLALKAASGIYLCYLAWRIATAAPPREDGAVGAPFTFMQAALFQWVNPKAWAMAVTAHSVYAPAHSMMGVILVTGVFGVVSLPSAGSWAALGHHMRRLLTDRRRLRAFNIVMALLLMGSLLPMIAL